MRTSFLVVLVLLLVMSIYLVSSIGYDNYKILQVNGIPDWFVIEGLVENPLNLTYAELWDFPLISEVATLQCVGSGGGSISVTYNWTGVPLFYLLSMARVIPGDYREVVFNATDGFSSSILLETAMHPTTILALEANGTDLRELDNLFAREYRVAVPCRWGYKWVKLISQIIVVDYDYKGTYEKNWGLSDEAFRPNCTVPSTNPPIVGFNATDHEELTVQALSNSSIEFFNFDPNSTLIFNVTGPQETNGYFYAMFPEQMLPEPYQIYIDQNPMIFSQTSSNHSVYIYFSYPHSIHTIEIRGEQYQAHGDINGDLAVNILDAILVANAFGSGPGDTNWNALVDLNYDEVIDVLDGVIFSRHFGEKWT